MSTYVVQACNLESNTPGVGGETGDREVSALLAQGVSLVHELACASDGGRVLHTVDVLCEIVEALCANTISMSAHTLQSSV
jgi:hypothetical protein